MKSRAKNTLWQWNRKLRQKTKQTNKVKPLNHGPGISLQSWLNIARNEHGALGKVGTHAVDKGESCFTHIVCLIF